MLKAFDFQKDECRLMNSEFQDNKKCFLDKLKGLENFKWFDQFNMSFQSTDGSYKNAKYLMIIPSGQLVSKNYY